RAEQPLDVLLQPEDPPAVRPDPLEDAVAIQEAMVEYRNPRVLSVHEPAVQIDLLAHTPLLSLEWVPKYSTAPGVLQHAPPACTLLLLFRPIHHSNAQPRGALWHVLPLHSASRFRPGCLVCRVVLLEEAPDVRHGVDLIDPLIVADPQDARAAQREPGPM